MDKKRVGNLFLMGGIVILAIAALIRIGNSAHLTALNIPDLWKLSVGFLLISIAANTSES